MADHKLDLATNLIRSYPDDAARLCEQMEGGQLSTLLHRLPEEAGANLLKSMLPQYSAQAVAHLDVSLAHSLLAKMDPFLIVILLRRLPRKARKALLDKLPTRIQATSSLLLNYGQETVGAWMDASAFTFPDDCSIGDALARISGPDIRTGEVVFVTDRDLKVRGQVPIASLVGPPPENPLISLVEPAPNGIAGRATMLSIEDHPAWKQADLVPVLNRHKQFVGALSHTRFRKGLRELSVRLPEPAESDVGAGVASVYGSTMLALLESLSQATGFGDGASRRERNQ